MKNYKFWLTVVIVLLIINSAVLVLMWFHKGRPGQNNYNRHIEPKDILINSLSLTAKQQALFTVMRNKHRQLTNNLNRQNHLLRDSLFNYIKATRLDTALINSLSAQISNNQSLAEKATLYHFREFRTILTGSQQEKFDSIIQDVLRMMGKPGGMPGPPNHREERPYGDDSRPPNGPPQQDLPPGEKLPPGPLPR